MFHRGKSSEQIERTGRYIHVINDMHKQGIYSSKEILLGLLQCYLDYQSGVLDSVVSMRGDVFKHADLVSRLKAHALQLDEDDCILHVIKWLNTRHLTLNPNDDIFYLISIFLSYYERHLVRVSASLKSRLIFQDKWSHYLVKSGDSIQQLTSSILGAAKDYQPYLIWLMQLVRDQQNILPEGLYKAICDHFEKAVKGWHPTNNHHLIPSQEERIKKKVCQMSALLPPHIVRWSLQFVDDFQKADKFVLENQFHELAILVNKLELYLAFFIPSEKDKIINYLLKLCDSSRINVVCNWLEKYHRHFSAGQIELVITKLNAVFFDVSDLHRVDICSILIFFKKIKSPIINDKVGNFLAAYIIKGNKQDKNALLLAARYFFLCAASRGMSVRCKVVEVLQDWFIEEPAVLVRAEIASLLLDENEAQRIDISQLVAQLVDFGFSGLEPQDDNLKYVCDMLVILEHQITPAEKKALISTPIHALKESKEFNERNVYILLALKYFIYPEHYEDIVNLIILWGKSSKVCKEPIFIEFIQAMKSILPENKIECMTPYILDIFRENPDIHHIPFSLIGEFSAYFTSVECFYIVSVVMGLICDGCERKVEFETDRDRVEACLFLQKFIPRLSLDQRLMFLNHATGEMQKENHFAGLIFLTMYYEYKIELVRDMLSRVKAESGRCLPPELIEPILQMGMK